MNTAKIVHLPHVCQKPQLDPMGGRPLPSGTIAECECGRRHIVSRSLLGAFWAPFTGKMPDRPNPPADEASK